MTLVEKLSDVRDFRRILETTVKEIGENYSADICQIVLSNPLNGNFTSICEYLPNPEEIPEDLASATFPVQPEGGGLGWLSLSRQNVLTAHEIDEIRLTLANIADILRYAQINDIVQRDTFRSAFMSEIINLMSLRMGLGDALFMVVNILGKALAVSRCIFICVDDSSSIDESEWKSYEYWQRERIEAAQEYGWPTKDSAVVAQTLLSTVPIIVFEGQQHSFKTPVQDEMEFIGVRSQLSVALRSSVGVHGCIIVQQCESRHAWTRDEIDMVQNVADTVAEALAQLDEEKKTAEPIMRLYQREVAETKDPSQKSMQEVRKALKSALGATTIKKAQKSRVPAATATPPPPPAPAVTAAQPAQTFAPPAQEKQKEISESRHPGSPESPIDLEAYDESKQPPQFSPSDIWTEHSGEISAPAEPNYEEAYLRASAETETAVESPEPKEESSGLNIGPDYEVAPELEPAYEVEPGIDSDFPLGPTYETEPNFETTPGEDAGPSYEVEPEVAPGQQLAGLANMLEEQASQPEPPQARPIGGFLGGLLVNQREGSHATGAWDVDTSRELPPPPTIRKATAREAKAPVEKPSTLPPAAELRPDIFPAVPTPTPPTPPSRTTVPPVPPLPAQKPPPPPLPPIPPRTLGPAQPPQTKIPPVPPRPGQTQVPPVPPLPGQKPVPPVPTLPGQPQVPPVPPLPGQTQIPPVPPLPGQPQIPPVPPLPGQPQGQALRAPEQRPEISTSPPETTSFPPHEPVSKAADKWADFVNPVKEPPPAPTQPSRTPSKWGDLDSIQSPGQTGRQTDTEWSQLDSIPTPSNTGKTGLGATMMGKAKALALAGSSSLGQSLHKGGVRPAAPANFVEGPPLEVDEAAAEAKLKQILASSNPTSDFIFATPGVEMRLLGRIDGWISEIEPKDKYVNGHVRSVAEYSMAVARLLGLGTDDINMIRLAAIIHDVGKLGLPKMILQKPDEELSDTELVMSMNHTIDGAKLIEEFHELAPLAPSVLGHHEEYDGNGYPEGLAGEEIPLAARIIHVCGAYTELVTDLVYRAGLPPEQAQSMIAAAAGSTYDQDVVQALLSCISQGLVPERIT